MSDTPTPEELLDNPDLLMDAPKRKGRPPKNDSDRPRLPKVDQHNYRGLALPDDPPVFKASEIAALESLAVAATPEEFQKGVAQFFRKLIVRGMENVPVPRTIKEIQALADMLRKAEGLEQKDKGNLITPGLVSARRVQRKSVVLEAVEGSPQTDSGDTGSDVDDFEV
jgi:hypothetical protein